MDKQLSYYSNINKKLDIIEKDIDNNQWEELAEKFIEIKTLKSKIDKEKLNNNKESETLTQRDKIRSKIDVIEEKINIWKESQKLKIENLKKKENHLNGYKKQPTRSYYIDKSE